MARGDREAGGGRGGGGRPPQADVLLRRRCTAALPRLLSGLRSSSQGAAAARAASNNSCYNCDRKRAKVHPSERHGEHHCPEHVRCIADARVGCEKGTKSCSQNNNNNKSLKRTTGHRRSRGRAPAMPPSQRSRTCDAPKSTPKESLHRGPERYVKGGTDHDVFLFLGGEQPRPEHAVHRGANRV